VHYDSILILPHGDPDARLFCSVAAVASESRQRGKSELLANSHVSRRGGMQVTSELNERLRLLLEITMACQSNANLHSRQRTATGLGLADMSSHWTSPSLCTEGIQWMFLAKFVGARKL
jgi:hypothetical protein